MVAEALVRALLAGPAWLYEFGIRTRIVAYETKYLKSQRLDTAVLSIGNVTVGGTGKTPLVEYVARYLSAEGYKVAILTRGYGRNSHGQKILNDPTDVPGSKSEDQVPGLPTEPLNVATADSPAAGDLARQSRITSGTLPYRQFGDEPVMLARALHSVPIVVNGKRVEAGRWAEQHLHPDVIILDDGYQHLALARDVNILVLDATDPFGGGRMVPFGRLREPVFAIKRADAIIVTRAHRPFDQAQMLSVIRYFCGDKIPIMYVYSSIVRLRHLVTGDVYDAGQFRGWNASIMCGVGNPTSFSDDLIQIGINIASENFFRDHHQFTQQDLERVTEEAGSAGADMIVTTEKDAVRLEGFTCGSVPVYAAELEIQSEDEVRLKSFLLRTLLVRR